MFSAWDFVALVAKIRSFQSCHQNETPYNDNTTRSCVTDLQLQNAPNFQENSKPKPSTPSTPSLNPQQPKSVPSCRPRPVLHLVLPGAQVASHSKAQARVLRLPGWFFFGRLVVCLIVRAQSKQCVYTKGFFRKQCVYTKSSGVREKRPWCQIEVPALSASVFLRGICRRFVLLLDVEVRFDCAGSRKVRCRLLSASVLRVCNYRRFVLLLDVEVRFDSAQSEVSTSVRERFAWYVPQIRAFA